MTFHGGEKEIKHPPSGKQSEQAKARKTQRQKFRETREKLRERQNTSRIISGKDCVYVQQGHAGKLANSSIEPDPNDLVLVATSGVNTCLGVAMWLDEAEVTHGLVAHLDSSHIGFESVELIKHKSEEEKEQIAHDTAQIYINELLELFPQLEHLNVTILSSVSTQKELLSAVKQAFVEREIKTEEPKFIEGAIDFALRLIPGNITVVPYIERDERRTDRAAPSRKILNLPKTGKISYYALLYKNKFLVDLPETHAEALNIANQRRKLALVVDERIKDLTANNTCSFFKKPDVERIQLFKLFKQNLIEYPTISLQNHIESFKEQHPKIARHGCFGCCSEPLFNSLIAAEARINPESEELPSSNIANEHTALIIGSSSKNYAGSSESISGPS